MRGVRRASRLVGTSVLGGVLVAAGVVMLITPGPGLVAIAAGLAVLSREFAWARRLLDRVRLRLLSRRFRRVDHRPSITDVPARHASAPVGPDQRHVA